MMSDESLRKAREELRKQFVEYVESLAKGFQRPKTYEDIDGVIKLRKAIDALDHAIENHWGEGDPGPKALTSAYRPVIVEKGVNDPDELDGLPGG
jgi:hypothetical protein